MKGTIHKVWRLVVRHARRDGVGVRPGVVEADEAFGERGGRLVIPKSGTQIDDDIVRSLRDAGEE
jgi:hypothetical protein